MDRDRVDFETNKLMSEYKDENAFGIGSRAYMVSRERNDGMGCATGDQEKKKELNISARHLVTMN